MFVAFSERESLARTYGIYAVYRAFIIKEHVGFSVVVPTEGIVSVLDKSFFQADIIRHAQIFGNVEVEPGG